MIAASSYYTEKRVVLGLGVWIVRRRFMCVDTAELRLLLLHAVAELCCVLYDVPHYENTLPRKLTTK